MRYVAIFEAGPAWVAGKPVHGQDRQVMHAHLCSMKRYYDQGKVLFGGPFRSNDGGIALVEAKSRMDAKALLEADPAVAAGILGYNLFEVQVFFDAVSGDAWSPAPPPDSGAPSI